MPVDLSGSYNTALNPNDEADFQKWAGPRTRDIYDYDLRGAWKSGAAASENGHLPDTFKKPNHPTFSNESQYSTEQTPGGEWVDKGSGKWGFKPSAYNIQAYGKDGLTQYFRENEPEATLEMTDMTIEQQRALAVASARARAAAQSDQSYTGSILPFSKNAQGDVSFDSNAGIVGDIKRAFTAPGRAMSGELQVMGPDGSVSPEAIAEGLNFAGVTSPMNPMVRSGEQVVPGVASSLRKNVDPPTTERLRAAASDGYETVRNMGVDYDTKAVNNLSGEIQANLTNDGIIAELAPKTYAILGKLAEAPEGSVASIGNLEAARRAFGHGGKDFANPTEQLAAQRATEALDGFLARPDPAAVVRGPAEEVSGILGDARGNYAAASRSRNLTELARAIELRANGANSGANSGNTTRQRIASLLLNKKQIAGYSPEEVAALEGVNAGSVAANATRRAGNMLGGGGGIGASLIGLAGAAAGALTRSPELTAMGASAPLAGMGMREISNILTERALAGVEKGVRKRSPLYEQMVKDAPSEADIPAGAASVIRALILSQQGSSGVNNN